jgi:hypothetical protein
MKGSTCCMSKKEGTQKYTLLSHGSQKVQNGEKSATVSYASDTAQAIRIY